MPTYLRCEYTEGIFSNEYLIRFRQSNPNSTPIMWVNKEDVITTSEHAGIVKIRIIYERDPSRAVIGINDVGDHRISTLTVPLEELIER